MKILVKVVIIIVSAESGILNCSMKMKEMLKMVDNPPRLICPRCGTSMQKVGFRHLVSGNRRRWRCPDCRKYKQERTISNSGQFVNEIIVSILDECGPMTFKDIISECVERQFKWTPTRRKLISVLKLDERVRKVEEDNIVMYELTGV